MNAPLIIVLLALGWAAATGAFSLPNLILGATVGGICLYLIRRHLAGPAQAPRLRRIAVLIVLFIKELFLSALRVARLVLRPDMAAHLRPAIIAFPLTATTDVEITLLANLITLTPGTLSVDVTEDRRFLLIHAIDVRDRDAFIREIAEGFEAKVIGACR